MFRGQEAPLNWSCPRGFRVMTATLRGGRVQKCVCVLVSSAEVDDRTFMFVRVVDVPVR